MSEKSFRDVKPFRVSYYKKCQVEVHGENRRAPLHSTLEWALTAEAARVAVASTPHDRIVVNAYPYYKTLKAPKRKTWFIVSGPESVATKQVLTDLAGMASHDRHEQLMERFTPKTKPEQNKWADLSTEQEVVETETCRWHGSAHIVDGRCTAIDAKGYMFPAFSLGSGTLFTTGIAAITSSTSTQTFPSGQGMTISMAFPKPTDAPALGEFFPPDRNLDEAAPVLHSKNPENQEDPEEQHGKDFIEEINYGSLFCSGTEPIEAPKESAFCCINCWVKANPILTVGTVVVLILFGLRLFHVI